MKQLGVIVATATVLAALFSPAVSHATTRARPMAETVLNDSPMRLAAGLNHTCQVNDDGTVRCWGRNENGQLGDGKAIVQLSADTGVDPGAEVRVAYSVDGGPPQEGVFGPANLANHQEFFEARTVIAVIPLARGGHTITAHWRVSGGSGKKAAMDNRCMTVEMRSA